DLAQAHLRFNQTGAGEIPDLAYATTPWIWLLAIGMAALIVLATLRRRDPAFEAGLGVMFALVVLSRYYYQILAVMAFSGQKRHMQALLALNLILVATGA